MRGELSKAEHFLHTIKHIRTEKCRICSRTRDTFSVGFHMTKHHSTPVNAQPNPFAGELVKVPDIHPSIHPPTALFCLYPFLHTPPTNSSIFASCSSEPKSSQSHNQKGKIRNVITYPFWPPPQPQRPTRKPKHLSFSPSANPVRSEG